MTEVRPALLIRCDGSAEIGLGHVVRCLALADELRDHHGAEVVFAMRRGPLGVDVVRRSGYPILSAPQAFFDYRTWIAQAARSSGARALVLDVRDDLSAEAVTALRGQGILIVTIDDPTERRLLADLAFYPPLPQVERLDWRGFTGHLYAGGDWVILRREFAAPPEKQPGTWPTMVLVAMGGSDPAGLTLLAVEALDLMDVKFEPVVMLGPGFSYRDEFDRLLARSRRAYTVVNDPQDVRQLMLKADLALASAGVTAYELAATGVPAVLLCLTEDHALSARMFAKRGAAVSLGVYSDVTRSAIADAVRGLLEDSGRREAMARAGRAIVDGRGAERVAARIVRGLAAGGTSAAAGA